MLIVMMISSAADPVIVPRRQIKQNPEMKRIVLTAIPVIVKGTPDCIPV